MIVLSYRCFLLHCWVPPFITTPDYLGGGTHLQFIISTEFGTISPRTIGLYKEQFDLLDDHYLTLPEILNEHGYYTFGITGNPNINKIFNFDQGFDTYIDSNSAWNFMDSITDKQLYAELKLPTANELFQLTHRALKKLTNKELKGPKYLQILLMDVHERHMAIRDKYRAMFTDEAAPKYQQSVKQVSEDIYQFISALSKVPEWRNTLFVITSDHGEGLGDHPGVPRSSHHGNVLYESQIHVPLILYYPESAYFGGKNIHQRVRLLELAPTILDVVGIEPPEDMNGISLLPLIKDAPLKQHLPENFVSETNWRDVNKIAVISADWKYIENRDRWRGVNPHELQKIGERENGIATDKIEQQNEVAEGLKLFLGQWEKEHLRTPPINAERPPTRGELQQLKSLGYLN